MSEEQKLQDEENEEQQEEEMDEPDEEEDEVEDKIEEADTEEGREQDDIAGKSQEAEDAEEAGHSPKKGCGRQKKNSAQKDDDESNEVKEIKAETSKKKGRGKRKKASQSHAAGDTQSGKKGRLKRSTGDGPDASDTPKAKKPKIQKERTIEPGRLRETPRLSYKDASSDDELNKYLEEQVVVSSDSEADWTLERRLSGKGRPEKKEAGALRERKRMLSYKDESDSDIESGFESDVIVPKKSKSPGKKGKGRPKKQDSHKKKTKGKKRGRKRLHPDTGPYVPTGKPRGRPKGGKNKPKVFYEDVDQLKEEAGASDLMDSKKEQSVEGEATLSGRAGRRAATQLKTDIDKQKESEISEENSDNDSEGSDQSESEEEESEMKESSTSARETMVS